MFDAWRGLVTGRPTTSPIFLKVPIRQGTVGGSGAFPGLTTDGREYWIKTLNNPQGPLVPATEQLVARAGVLIGAPCCAVELIQIPAAIAGWSIRPSVMLEAGLAHGSLALASAIDQPGSPGQRTSDNNAVRHVGYFALFDWCWGGDPQGLLAMDQKEAYYSHDHGWFLPPNGPAWDAASLRANVDVPHEFGDDISGLDPAEVKRIAQRLDTITRDELIGVVTNIPANWPVTNEDLEHVGAFLEVRAPVVADRLRSRFGITS